MLLPRSKGFTIVELLIVIVVIAILAAITVVAYNGISQRAGAAILQDDLSGAARSLGLSNVDDGRYPASAGAANGGKGLQVSTYTTLSYISNADGTAYCAQAHNDNISYFITHENTSPRTGTCSGSTGIAGDGAVESDIVANAPIQSVTSGQCSFMPVYSGTNENAIRTVTDERGGTTRTYRIAKLGDGKCWMLDNLKLGSTTSAITLTSSDSDVDSNFTLPQLKTLDSTGYFNDPGVFGPLPGDTGTGAANYGYLYNWAAATTSATKSSLPSGSGNASHSVCPAGWRLPTGGTTSSDFAQLDVVFGGTGSRVTSTGPSLEQWKSGGAFKGVYSGNWRGYNNEFFRDQGGRSYFWTSSAHPTNNTYAYFANFNGTYYKISPGDSYVYSGSGRDMGYAVRCILR